MTTHPRLGPLRSMLRHALSGLRGLDDSPAASSAPRRKPAVERASVVLDPRRVGRYLTATGGERMRAAGSLAHALPPTCSTLWETTLAQELLALVAGRPAVRGLVHLESELVSVRPLRPGDVLRCRLELERLERHPAGTLLELRSRCWNGPGQLCQENLLRVLAPGGGKPPVPEGTTGVEAQGRWRTLTEWTLPGAHGWRYARASGDYSPTHLWGWSARLAGLAGPVLPGPCAGGLAGHALIEHLLGGDPAALRRLRVRFHAPIELPARVRLVVTDGAEETGRFRLVDARREERRPLAEGEFVGTPPR